MFNRQKFCWVYIGFLPIEPYQEWQSAYPIGSTYGLFDSPEAAIIDSLQEAHFMNACKDPFLFTSIQLFLLTIDVQDNTILKASYVLTYTGHLNMGPLIA